MNVVLKDGFQKDVRALAPDDRGRALEVVLAVPKALGSPHLHAGLGLRKIHKKGVWEARVGVDVRLVFTITDGALTFLLAGTHDDVWRHLRTL